MKISEEPHIVPVDPAPCGEPCASTFWEIDSWEDITVGEIKRYTLLNYDPAAPISTDPPPEIESTSIKEDSETVIPPSEIPRALRNVIEETLGVGETKGFLGDAQPCAWPCSCVLNDSTRYVEGREETSREMEFRYEERREMKRWGNAAGQIPTIDALLDPRTGRRPTGFDNETDVIRKGRFRRGIHPEQMWDIVRTYLAVVRLDIRHSVVLYMGMCWHEVV